MVEVHQPPDRSLYLPDILKRQTIDNLLFAGPDKAFGHALGLGLLEKGKAGADTPEFQRVLAMVRPVSGAVL